MTRDGFFHKFIALEQKISGPMRLEGAYLIASVMRGLAQRGVTGNALEIGVFEGRSSIPAACFLEEGEIFYAIDPFGDIQANPTLKYGGVGNDVAFTANWERVFGDLRRLRMFRATSEQVGKDKQKIAEWTPFKYISVDGDHSYNGTLLDLRLAAAHVAENGVVAVDDVFNVEWPSVSQALYTFLSEVPSLRPFCEGWGRVFMCSPEKVREYQTVVRAMFVDYQIPLFEHLRVVHTFPFYGIEIDVYTNRWGSASKPDLPPEAYEAGARYQELRASNPKRAAEIYRALFKDAK